MNDSRGLGDVQIPEIDSLEMVAMGPRDICIHDFFLVFKRMY